MLKLFGVSESDVIWHDITRAYHFCEVNLFRETRWFFYVFGRDRQLFRRLAEHALEDAIAPAQRIFVSRLARTRRGAYRGLVNESELIDALIPLGFTPIEPEKLSATDQIRAFAGADAVVGLGGAGMFKTVFCRSGTRVLDIESTPTFVEAHANILASLGHRYAILIGEADPTDDRIYNRRWRLDIDKTVYLVRRMFEL
jgi:capsular polysaccharide biosynthesis protein